MRVWALASCGGLLALAACSVDQANTADPNSPLADADGLSQGQKSLPTATPSPLARPAMPAQQGLSARPRLNPAAVSGGADRTASQIQPQADQLRARLQRLRDRQGTRLASSTPVAAAPIPTVVASPTPQPGAPTPLLTASSPGVIASPTAPLPNRVEQSPLVVTPTPLPSPQPTVTRLHGSKSPALATQPRGRGTAPGSEAEATLVPDSTQASAALLARAPEAAIAREHAVSQSRAGSPITLTHSENFPGGSPAGGAHRQGATTPLRSAERLPLQASLAPRTASLETGDQSLGAIALPESLPLHSAVPRLSPQRQPLSVAPLSVAPLSVAPLSVAPLSVAPLSVAPLSVAPPAVPQPDISQLVITDRTATEPLTEPLTVPAGGHLSQADLDRARLVPSASQSPKGLPLAHCPPTSAHNPTADRLINGAIAAQPSFSGRNQSMTPVKAAPTTPCWGNATTEEVALEPMPAAPVPDDLDFAPASVADSDLETLAPAPSSD